VTDWSPERARRVNAAITESLKGFKSGRRHRCEVTADRLGDDLMRYPDAFDGKARDAIGLIRFILQDIATRETGGEKS
jgi:hypothetical protein